MVDINLTEEEFDSFINLKKEHFPYFNAIIYAMGVIVDRNHKYTGHAIDRNVFENFIQDAEIQGIPVEQSFRQWISKKVARIMLNDGNYADESFSDSLRDLANYALLWIGWLEGRKIIIEEHDFARASEPDMDIGVKDLIDDETFRQPYKNTNGYFNKGVKGNDNIKE